MSNIGLVVIATNKYITFVRPLLDSVRKHFLTNHKVTLFLFTDKMEDSVCSEPDVVAIAQSHMLWPGSTLFRYNIFNASKDKLKEMDYLFYSDADMLFVDTVGDEILGERVATIHPGFYNKSRNAFTYETRRESKAYVSPSDGSRYYAGGFNGGTSSEFLKMCLVLSERIIGEFEKGFIAVWHDESHMNRYFIDNPPTRELSPSYCYPESWSLPFERRLLALDKNHEEMRK